MMRHAKDKEQCATFCISIGIHCHSIIWNERQKFCILDKASTNSVADSNTWKEWITCVRGKYNNEVIILWHLHYSIKISKMAELYNYFLLK